MTIVSITHIQNKGRAAAQRKESRDSHGMNWGADALPHWLEGFDSARGVHTSPASHTAPAGQLRVDQAQVRP